MAKRPSLRESFGRRVRALREAGRPRLSQEKFALAAGVERAHYARIERGEVNCSLDTIALIAAGLGVEPRELFEFGGA